MQLPGMRVLLFGTLVGLLLGGAALGEDGTAACNAKRDAPCCGTNGWTTDGREHSWDVTAYTHGDPICCHFKWKLYTKGSKTCYDYYGLHYDSGACPQPPP